MKDWYSACQNPKQDLVLDVHMITFFPPFWHPDYSLAKITAILHLSFDPTFINVSIELDKQFTETYIKIINNPSITNKLFNNQSNIIPTQQQLSKHITDILWRELLSRTTSAQGITHLLSSRAYGAGAMLDAIPTNVATTMAPTYFRMACMIRLNHRFLDIPKQCSMRGCKRTIDIYAFHPLNCMHGGDIHLTYQKIYRLITGWCKKANFNPTNEQNNLFSNEMRSEDIFIPCFEGGMPLCIDVGVISPLGWNLVNGSKRRKPGFAARKYENNKQNKYRVTCRKNNMHFLPFIVETLGGMGEEANKFMGIMANIFAAKAHSSVGTQKRTLMQELSCIIWSASSRRVINRIYH